MFALQPRELDDGSGTTKQGFLMECTCGGDIFHAFVLNGMSCLHYQCAQCEVSVCTHGRCPTIIPGEPNANERTEGLHQR